MVIFDERFFIGAAVLLIAYTAFRILTSKKEQSFEKEVEEIIKSETYKTKGRFD